MKIPVIAIVGPTASGKTALAVELAKSIGGEVVSADSMQIYKGMDIATAKPTAEEMQGVPHHLIGFLDPNVPFSCPEYVRMAHTVLEDIHSRGKIPVVCGGTGLYIDSLLLNIDFGQELEDTEKKREIRRVCENMSGEELLDILKKFDPECAQRLHPNNRNRIIRAIEVYELTGITQTEAQRRSRLNETPYDTIWICLDYRDRQKLYGRIDSRVDRMMENGLVDEARDYISLHRDSTASQAIGYKELKPYLEGSLSLEQASDNLKKATRHYAKRQLTWFRKNPELHRIFCDDFGSLDEIKQQAENIIEQEREKTEE